MAREILLRFGTTNLKKAREVSKKVLKNIRESAKGIKDVEKRRQAVQAARAQGIEERQILNQERDRQRGDRRSLRARRKARAFQAPGGVPRFGDPDESIIQATEGLGAFRSLDLAAKSLIAFPIVEELLSPILEEFVRPLLRAEFAALERKRLDPILARLDRIEADSLERRLREDLFLQERLAGEAAAQNRVIEDAIRSKRLAKTSRVSRLSALGG